MRIIHDAELYLFIFAVQEKKESAHSFNPTNECYEILPHSMLAEWPTRPGL